MQPADDHNNESPFADPEILCESGPILVLNKPGGLLTQAPPGIDNLELRLRRFLKRRESHPGNIYLAVLHRLDRGVAGAIVFARNVRVARKLSRQFEERQVIKRYWAIVEGVPAESHGRWTDFMRKIPGEARSELVVSDSADAQFAALDYRILASTTDQSILEIELETGRTHQIRLQCGSRNFPVIGDYLYGATMPFGPATHDTRAQWIGLMARQLCFVHPANQEVIDVTAPRSTYWKQMDWRDDVVDDLNKTQSPKE